MLKDKTITTSAPGKVKQAKKKPLPNVEASDSGRVISVCGRNYCVMPKRRRYSVEFIKPLTIVRESVG